MCANFNLLVIFNYTASLMQGYCLHVFCEGQNTLDPVSPQGPLVSISELGLPRAGWGDQSLRHLPGHQVKWQKFILQDFWSLRPLWH